MVAWRLLVTARTILTRVCEGMADVSELVTNAVVQ